MPAISTNIAANSAVAYLNINSQQETSALSKLSSGRRIVAASDDAAGLAISTRISSDITTLQQAANELKLQGDSIAADLRSSVDTLSATLASRVLGVEVTSESATTAPGR